MSTQWGRRASMAPLRDLLPLLLMAAGLFFMHGLQASADPFEHTGITIAAGMPESGHAGARRVSTDQLPAHGSSGHGHAAGQMCLGLLSMLMTALLFLSGLFSGRSLPPAPRRAGHRLDRQGRSPPSRSIFQLSVMRT